MRANCWEQCWVAAILWAHRKALNKRCVPAVWLVFPHWSRDVCRSRKWAFEGSFSFLIELVGVDLWGSIYVIGFCVCVYELSLSWVLLWSCNHNGTSSWSLEAIMALGCMCTQCWEESLVGSELGCPGCTPRTVPAWERSSFPTGLQVFRMLQLKAQCSAKSPLQHTWEGGVCIAVVRITCLLLWCNFTTTNFFFFFLICKQDKIWLWILVMNWKILTLYRGLLC